MVQIPKDHVLTGDLVDLRTPTQRDYKALQDLLNDKETMAALLPYFKVDYWTDKMVNDRYKGFQNRQNQGVDLNYVIIDRKSGKLVGNCGFKNIDVGSKNAEFGIILHKSIWGTGVSKECHRLCLDYAFNVLKLNSVYFKTDNDNHRMKGFFYKMGLSPKSIDELLVFELNRDNWPTTRETL